VPGKDKPYKVYRGGRAKGPIRPVREPADGRRDGKGKDGGAKVAKPRRKRRWARIAVLFVVFVLLAALVWGLLGYLAVRSGVQEANERLPEGTEEALTPPNGSMLTTARTILVLGADRGGRREDRQGTGRSDSIMLIRTDPDDHRISYLSIPRDLRVDIPGRGPDKVNAAFAHGGPALSIDTVESLTGLEVNHVIVVDFATFEEVIDAVGGITINNPTRVLSNPFDCPFKGAEACAEFDGWRFRKGEIELDGRRALIYARTRENQLDPGESDITRGERQQRVLQALMAKITGLDGYFRMPLVGDDIVKPLATDLSTNELLAFAWVRRRAADEKTLRCRLGGTPGTIDGSSVIQSSEDNALVVAMITGQTAPQRPPAGQPFAPGCFVGPAGG
jgi:LCP family protein required for cell wall assembly